MKRILIFMNPEPLVDNNVPNKPFMSEPLRRQTLISLTAYNLAKANNCIDSVG